MPNKYELRRRSLKDVKSRDNPFASPRYGGKVRPVEYEYAPPPTVGRPVLTAMLGLGLFMMIVLLYVQTVRHQFTVCDDNVYIYESPRSSAG